MALGVLQDYDIGLVAYDAAGGPIGWLPHPQSLQVAFPLSDMPSLVFEYHKDSPGAQWLVTKTRGIEIGVKIWIKSKDQWIEPPNGRFLLLQWEDDVTDAGNIIRFTCPGIAWLLSKQVIMKGKRDDALNHAEEAAKDAYESLKNTHRTRQSNMNSVMSNVKSAMRYKGGTYVLPYFPKTVKSGGKNVKPKNKSILYHVNRQKFYWYKSSTSKWYRISKNEANNYLGSARTAYLAMQTAEANMIQAKLKMDRAIFNAREATKGGKRPMLKTTAGWAMKRHWDEAKARGGERLKGLYRGFNGTYSTGRDGVMGKKKWGTTFDIDLTIGMSLLDLLQQLTEMGVCEWQFRGRKLDLMKPGVYNHDSSSRVGLHLGKDLTEAPDKATRFDYADYLVVRGEDNLSFGMRPSNPDRRTGWGTWEKSVSASGAKKVADAKKIVLREAKDSLRAIRLESTRGLMVRQDGPRPMYDYLPGHYIRVYGTDGAMQKVRVMQVTLTREQGGHVSGNLVLGDRFLKAALDFRKSMSTTVGGYEKTIGGGTVPALPAPTPGVPERAKWAPPSLSISARVGINEANGRSETILSLGWTPPGEDVFEPMAPDDEPGDETDPDENNPEY
ncbi:hypothetical protein AUR04nite_00600 [Glutamicibacter uratoxydans]|uniref:Uncharacterized protein n=1 Tax=Glutamicibacter uratoxydans TaxID=43667 RepID=A0A4Y4DMF2_GLUUR|nr:hypothetical protein [Glutamicibacter uratoxydans]GED04528.1 hypothetical protein AUR04nite_00600 [Glutamicibacter uratoxydans]